MLNPFLNRQMRFTLYLFFLIGLLGALVVRTVQLTQASTARTASETAVQARARLAEASNPFTGAASSGNQVWADCLPARVAVFGNRIHVRCTAAVSNLWYFAYPTTDDAEAARVLSLMTTAQVTGQTLGVLYDPNDTTSGPAVGCLAADCRLLLALEMK